MPSASSAAAREPNRSNPRTAPVRDLPPTSEGSRSRVVIRLPALPSEETELIETAPLASESIPAAPEVDLEAPSDSIPADPNNAEEMTTFVIHHSSPNKAEAASPNADRNPLPNREQVAPAADPVKVSAQAPPQAGVAVHRRISSAWGAVRHVHAFVMQPKIWLVCVLCCFGVLLTVFVLLPPEAPSELPQAGAKASHANRATPAEPATRIVAPPADLSPAADARQYEVQPSAGIAGPLGPVVATETETEATGDGVRIASEAKLGPRDSRYDGQTPAGERGGAAIYDVAPLDRSDDGISEDSSLR